MSKPEDVLKLVGNSVAAAASDLEVGCPKCSNVMYLRRTAAYQNTSLLLTLTVADGHMLQAHTLGGTMIEMSKLMRSMAKQMGANIQVLVENVEFTDKTISVNFRTLRVGEAQPPRGEKSAVSE